MALAQEITKIVVVADSSGSLQSKYFFINAIETDSTTNVGYKIVEYYVWLDVSSGGSDPSISGKTGVEVNVSTNDTASTVATAVKNALDGLSNFSASVGVGAGNDTTVTVTNANRGSVEDASDNNTGFTISTTTQGTGGLSSNISHPEDNAYYFIKGSSLGLVTDVISSGSLRSTERKKLLASSESIINGLLIHYWGEPKKVTAITDTPDIDNAFHLAIVDYVKMCLYMDRTGTQMGEGAGVSLQLSQMHRSKFLETVRRFGDRRREKTGGVRSILPANFQ